MTTDTATRGPAYDGPMLDEMHGATGSRARMAALLHLGNRPEGATTQDLKLVMEAAVGDKLSIDQAAHVLQSLRRAERITCERHGQLGGLWYSPAARRAAFARTGWRLQVRDVRDTTAPMQACRPATSQASTTAEVAL